MDSPLELTFHNMSSSESLEAMIRERVEKLDRRYGRLIGCRVSVEALHRQHQSGNIYECHIVMSVPGRDLAVSQGPHRAKQKYAHPDVRDLDPRGVRCRGAAVAGAQAANPHGYHAPADRR